MKEGYEKKMKVIYQIITAENSNARWKKLMIILSGYRSKNGMKYV